MKNIVFGDFDVTDFWEKSDYARKNYTAGKLTDAKLKSCEGKLGYKLPRAYVELMRNRNGGIPCNKNHRTRTPTSWADDHVAITGIFAIDDKKFYSLCSPYGSRFAIDEWGYPPIGVYCADCPSAGHDMLCLDYRKCGPRGEPRVVHVDQENYYKITAVAPNFQAFIRGLESDDAFE
jgi:hypothetical protein